MKITGKSFSLMMQSYKFYLFLLYTVVIVLDPLTSFRAGLEILLGLVLIFDYVHYTLRKKKPFLKLQFSLKSQWILYTLIVVLSVITSSYFSESLKNFRREYLRLFITFFAGCYFLTTPRRMRLFEKWQIGANLLICIPVLIFPFSKDLLLKWNMLHAPGQIAGHLNEQISLIRFEGLLGSYTRMAFYFIFALLYGYLRLLTTKQSFPKKAFFIVLIGINLYGCFITKTRIALIAVAVGFTVISILHLLFKKKQRLRSIGTISACCIIFSLPLFNQNIRARISSTYSEFQSKNGSFQDRLVFLQDTRKLLNKEWKLFGYGYSKKSYRKIHKLYPEINPNEFIDPHNEFIQFYFEYGIIGIFIFSLILLQLYKKSWLMRNRNEFAKAMNIYFTALIAAYFMVSTVDHFFCKDTAKYFILFFALQNNLSGLKLRNSSTSQ